MRIRIINLGEIITPNISNAIGALTNIIADKKSPSNPADIGKAIGTVLYGKMNLINDFKLGRIDESHFGVA